MNLVVLDGFTLNPGDLNWEGLKALGTCSIHDRTAPDLVLERAKVVDESGRPVDLEALREDAPGDQLLEIADDGIDHTGHDHD